jgi:hypothetical protein
VKSWKTLLLVYRELDVYLPVGRDSVEPAKSGSADVALPRKQAKDFIM